MAFLTPLQEKCLKNNFPKKYNFCSRCEVQSFHFSLKSLNLQLPVKAGSI
jgi:hypothetical protein